MNPGDLRAVDTAAAEVGLARLGAFAPAPSDGAPEGTGTLVLLGPRGGAMWARFSAAPEAADGAPDPLDRWSARVIGAIASRLGVRALFPFGGPPHAPFFAWARASGRAWRSPIGLLVHDELGLSASWRGALAFPGRLAAPPATTLRPCGTCLAPCRTACPVGAFGEDGYDVAACRAHLARPEGAPCREGGCLARRACPVGVEFSPAPAQAAFHLAAFRGAAMLSDCA
jgi:hypothetical protein